MMLNSIKVSRMKEFTTFERKNEYIEYLKKFDMNFLIRFLSEDCVQFLKTLSSKKCPDFEHPIDLKWNGFKVLYNVPSKNQAKFIECQHSIYSVVRLVSWSNFIMILTAVVLEKHVVFVHPDREVVAHLM